MGFTRGHAGTRKPTGRVLKRDGGSRSAFIRTITMTYRLTGHPCNDIWIVGEPEEMAPAKGTAGSPLPVAPEKLVSPQSTHAQTDINMCAVIN